MSLHKITIKDVAKEAGVSIASVSRYLNNPSSLRRPNRERIAAAAKKLNYHPLVHAQRLAGGKLNTFGLIIPGYEGIFHSFYAVEIIRSAGLALEKTNVDLHLHIFWNKDNFKASLVDGAIFADIINNEHQLFRLVREELPVVVINKKVEEEKVNYVAIDNYKGAYEATEFLIKHGHKKIAHLAGDLNVQCAKERLDGFVDALKNHGISVDDRYIKNANFSRLQARYMLDELYALENPPTAVFSSSDEMALEALYFAKERNINVPRQLSVVGFDDNPHCVYPEAGLTTVRQPIEKMTTIAVDILQKCRDQKVEGSQKIVLNPELIIRDTVDFI